MVLGSVPGADAANAPNRRTRHDPRPSPSPIHSRLANVDKICNTVLQIDGHAMHRWTVVRKSKLAMLLQRNTLVVICVKSFDPRQ